MGEIGDQMSDHWTEIDPSEDLNDVLLGTPTCIGRKRRRWRKSMDGGAPQTGHLERFGSWDRVADHWAAIPAPNGVLLGKLQHSPTYFGYWMRMPLGRWCLGWYWWASCKPDAHTFSKMRMRIRAGQQQHCVALSSDKKAIGEMDWGFLCSSTAECHR